MPGRPYSRLDERDTRPRPFDRINTTTVFAGHIVRHILNEDLT